MTESEDLKRAREDFLHRVRGKIRREELGRKLIKEEQGARLRAHGERTDEMSDDVVTAAAIAIREACKDFRDPVYCYVEGEAFHRAEEEAEKEGGSIFDDDARWQKDWNLESWKILASAAIEALKAKGWRPA